MDNPHFVLTHSSAVWIGLSDSSSEGTFVWQDGDSLGYEEFAVSNGNSGKQTSFLNVIKPLKVLRCFMYHFRGTFTAVFENYNDPKSFSNKGTL